MNITVKQLQGGECSVQVNPTTFIHEIKLEVSKKLGIPMAQQKLLLVGRTLADELTVESYPTIKGGTKLNLVVKKPDGLYEVTLKHFRKLGLSEADASNSAKKLLKVTQMNFNRLSWDDIERLSVDSLLSEGYQVDASQAALAMDSDEL